MTDTKPPVSIHELIQLAHIGIPGDQVTWSRVTMTSDRWIAIRHSNRDDKESMVTVLNPKDGVISYAGQTSADSIQMNPTQPVIALKAGARFEVFNFDSKVMISKTKIHEPVVFWTWLNSDIIAMVTDTLIYHWDLWQTGNPPERVFSRHPRLAFSEIISYKADPSLNTDSQGIVGVTRGGQIVTVDIKKDGFIKYVRDTAKKTNQANRLEKAISIQVDNDGDKHVPQDNSTSSHRQREPSAHSLRDANSNIRD